MLGCKAFLVNELVSVLIGGLAVAHGKVISPERQRVARPVRPSAPESEASITLVVARHLCRGGRAGELIGVYAGYRG